METALAGFAKTYCLATYSALCSLGGMRLNFHRVVTHLLYKQALGGVAQHARGEGGGARMPLILRGEVC